jgi:uncharacterized protein YbjQ (UPF0145 family)
MTNLSHKRKNMILSNIDYLPNQTIIKQLGLVQGSTVRAKNVGKDIFASLKNIVGGELTQYTELMQEAREEATLRMMEEAKRLGANAIINVRFATTTVTAGAAELFVYGTAVLVE